MMTVPTKDFLRQRRDRALGAILGNAERNIWPKLEKAEQDAFRRVVLDALNGYHETILDLMKAEDGTIRNEKVIEMLQKLYEQRQRRD